MKTNEQAKQEAIKKAYGKWFPELEDLINRFGTVTKRKAPAHLQNIFGDYFWDNQDGEWWPKSITGIYNNRGWIRIEPDGSNLPERDLMCKWLDINNPNNRVEDNYNFVRTGKTDSWLISTFTHYNLIILEELPIY